MFNFKKRRLDFRRSAYSNGRPAIIVVEPKTGEQWAVLTCNLVDCDIPDGEFAVKTWSENREISEACYNTGIFEDTGKRLSNGLVQAEIWKMAKGYVLEKMEPLT